MGGVRPPPPPQPPPLGDAELLSKTLPPSPVQVTVATEPWPASNGYSATERPHVTGDRSGLVNVLLHRPSPNVPPQEATNNGKDGEHPALFTTSVTISHQSPPRPISPEHPLLARSKGACVHSAGTERTVRT